MNTRKWLKEAERLLTKAEWDGPHEGPQGGTYWVNAETGEKVYDDPTGEGDQGESDMAGLDSADSDEVVDAIERFWDVQTRNRFEAMDDDEMLDELESVTTQEDREKIADLVGSDSRQDAVDAVAEFDETVDASEIVDALDLDYGNRTEFRELESQEQRRLREGLSAVYGDDVEDFYETVGDWKRSSAGEAGKKLEEIFMAAADLEGESFRDVDAGELTDEQVQIGRAMTEVSRRFMEQEHGEEVQVSRGISEEAWEKYQESDDDSFEMSAMAVAESGHGDVAESFALDNGTAVIEWTVPTDEVTFAMDAITSQSGINTMMEAEVQVPGGEVTPDEVHEV